MRKEPLNVIIAKNIKKYREAKGLSQERLSLLAGLHHSTVGHLERLKHDPGPATIEKIADALGIPETRLLERNMEND